MQENLPWLKNYADVKFNLEYPQCTISQAILNSAEKFPNQPALSFFSIDIRYKKLKKSIFKAAAAFKRIGISKNDRVLLCMPNMPQNVYCLYALNLIGAVACLIHPLSAEGEVDFYINKTNCKCAVVLDDFLYKFNNKNIDILISVSLEDELLFYKAVFYKLFKKAKNNFSGKFIKYKEFTKDVYFNEKDIVKSNSSDTAAILFSGGTTGKTKGILLSNYNFNALAVQTNEMCHYPVQAKSMLAAIPMFHGFGLGVCVHTLLYNGGKSILVPRFNVKSYAKLLKKEKPNYIAGVPSLFKAIINSDYMNNIDLSCLLGVFSGGDSLSVSLKEELDFFLLNHNSKVKVREGYGTTECLSASCLTPYHMEKKGSIGLPYPDTYYKICKPYTTDDLGLDKEGEICISGPTVMKEYLDNPEETNNALKKHSDGRLWFHTGDLGLIDSDGFIYFKQRLKRIIVSRGYNIYPSQLESVLNSHYDVSESCVVGVYDSYKMQKVKAYVVLKNQCEQNEEKIIKDIKEHCIKNIAKYALPYKIEIIKELPKTLLGKVDYRKLEQEE